MGLKKRNKVNPEFSMSSLTDIIFLLLIFFMLTSSIVNLNQFTLPESNSKTVAPTNIVVAINKKAEYFVNGKQTSKRSVYSGVRKALATTDNRKNATITIVAEVDVPFDRVLDIMEIANRLKMKAIIATQPKS